MRWLDFYWQAAPSFSGGHAAPDGGWPEWPRAASALHGAAFHLSWLDPLAPIAIGGIWMWFFIRQLGKRTLLPIQDPYIREALNHD